MRRQFVIILFVYIVRVCRGLAQAGVITRIIGGEPADIQDFPYQLSLEAYPEIGYEHVCGASVISEDWAVTAGHCIYPLQGSIYRLRGGTSIKETGGEIYEIEESFIHPEYDDDTLDFDIAVIKVSKPFQYSNVLQPIALAKATPSSGTSVVLTGWGCVNFDETETYKLHKVTLSVINHSVCQAVFRLYTDVTLPVLCAKVLGGDKNACKGDSGSPLVTKEKQLVGIAIRASSIIPVVHTNVAYLRDWITSVTGVI